MWSQPRTLDTVRSFARHIQRSTVSVRSRLPRERKMSFAPGRDRHRTAMRNPGLEKWGVLVLSSQTTCLEKYKATTSFEFNKHFPWNLTFYRNEHNRDVIQLRSCKRRRASSDNRRLTSKKCPSISVLIHSVWSVKLIYSIMTVRQQIHGRFYTKSACDKTARVAIGKQGKR